MAVTPTWVDVSNDLVAFSLKRGRQHQLDRIEAGTASVLLKNLHGDYWPNNDGGEYYPNVKLGKRINIRVNYDETDYDEYTGFVRKWNPRWFSREGNLYPGMLVECADLQRNLARAKLNTSYELELSGTRIGHVLDDVDWPAANRDIDAGKEYLIATGAMENVISMEHLFKVQESELGSFFIAGNGDTVFHERGALKDLASQATFGTGNLPIHNPVFPLDDELLYNEIRMNREGGTEQSHSDAASILAFGLRTLSRSGLLLTSDVIVFVYCLYLLARYHDAKMRIKSFTVKPQTPGYEAQLWPLVLGLEIGQKITLVWTEADIDGDYFIEGIEHSWDYREGIWVTKYQCSDAGQYYYTPDETQQTIRPDGVGAYAQNSIGGSSPAPTNWQSVDEETSDEGVTLVQTISPGAVDWVHDSHQTTPEYAAEAISKVKIYCRMKCTVLAALRPMGRTLIRTHATLYYGTTYELTLGWVTYSKEYTLNPNTGEAWTAAELADLQIGVDLKGGIQEGHDSGYAQCTQTWAEVDFTPEW